MPQATARRRLTEDQVRLLGHVVAAVSVLCATGAVVLHHLIEERADVSALYLGNIVVGAGWPLAGVVVIRARPRDVCGWLLLGTGTLAVYELLSQYSLWSARVAEQPLPGAKLTDWVSMFGFGVYFFVLPLLPLLFPDGRPVGRFSQRLARAVVVVASTAVVARMLVPERSDTDPSIQNPIGVPGLEVLNWVVLAASYFCVLFATSAAVVSLVRRTRRSVGVERAQLQWFMLGGVWLLVGLLLSQLTHDTATADVVFAAGMCGPPLGVVVATVRHRLFDVEFALSRTLVMVVVVAVVGGAWAGIVLAMSPDLTDSRPGILLVAGFGVAAVATRDLLQRRVDRWWFPQRQGTTLLGQRFAEAVSFAAEPREALTELVVAVRSTLRLSYVGFVGEISVSDGTRPDVVVAIDAIALGRPVGTLEVTSRREGEGFTRDERRALDEVASQAAMMAYAAQLVADVEDNRARIVLAAEEERRRLRNDLHDGVGPSLAGIALQLDALAAGLARDGQDDAAQIARAARDRVRTTVADVRAVTHGLRPPILDQIGLAEALRQLVSGLGTIEGDAVIDDLGGLSAAVEVATYSIASEAIGNAARHSAASRIRLDVERTADRLTLRVSDNGRGMPPRASAGVGLASMRQRALEVGGRVEHHAAVGGGTVVTLRLPLDVRSVAREAPRL